MANPLSEVSVFDRHAGRATQLAVVNLDRLSAYYYIHRGWWRGLRIRMDIEGLSARNEADYEWHWPREVRRHRKKAEYECLGLKSARGPIEGAIIYRINEQSVIQGGVGAVFVEMIAAAPRNRSYLCDNPPYDEIGPAMISLAILHSYALGYGGRVSLCPVGGSTIFYEGIGFQKTIALKAGMLVYEIPDKLAVGFLKGRGIL